MKERNTKQKDIILSVVKNNRIHPTIYEICDLAKKIDPSIGQATVYRNVKKFVDEGTIYIVKTKSGIDRYDYYTDHIHFECIKCGKVIDIVDDKLVDQIKRNFSNQELDIKNYNLSLDGHRKECSKEK